MRGTITTSGVVHEIENQFFDGRSYIGLFRDGHSGVRDIIAALTAGMPE